MSNAGVIGFSLGLATGGFTSGIDRAKAGIGGLVSAGFRLPVLGAALGSLIGSVGSINSVVENTFHAITRGAELNQLSKRSGETVGALFSLEKGMKGVGLAGEAAGFQLMQARKAVGGFNEMGEPTKDIFAGLGLSVEKLKDADGPELLQSIYDGLAKLNRSEAVNAAGKIFGRGGAGDALQIARSGEAFRMSIKGASEQAALFQRNAEAFEKIELSIGKLKGKFNSLFAGLAEAAAPGIQALLDRMNNINIQGFGKKVGEVFTSIAESVQEGRLSEVLELSIKAGIQGGSDFMLTKIMEWSDAVRKAFSNPDSKDGQGSFLNRAGAGIVGVTEGTLALWDQLGAKMGVPGAQEMADFRTDSANSWFKLAGLDNGILDKAAEAFVAGIEGRKNEYADQLKDTFAELLATARARAQQETAKAGAKGIIGENNSKSATQKNVNDLERIGLLFFAQNNRQDYARQTADNTREAIRVLDRIRAGVEKFDKFDNDFRNLA
jgi:hypothetical protein